MRRSQLKPAPRDLLTGVTVVRSNSKDKGLQDKQLFTSCIDWHLLIFLQDDHLSQGYASSTWTRNRLEKAQRAATRRGGGDSVFSASARMEPKDAAAAITRGS